MKEFIQSITYWKMAAFRCLIYMVVVALTTFNSMTETYTGDEWMDLSQFEQIRIYFMCGITAFGALLAFLDQTMSKLSGAKNGTLGQPVIAIPAPAKQEPPMPSTNEKNTSTP